MASGVQAGLIHRYTFDGQDATDTAGDLDGTPAGATFSTDAAQGAYSARFDGADDYAGFDASAFNATAFSVAMWVKPAALGNNVQALVSNKTGGAADGFSVFFNSFGTGDGTLWMETGNGTVGDSAWTDAGLVTAGGWQHVAYTVERAGGQARIYHAGQDESTDTSILDGFDVGGPWRMGLFTDDQFPLDGRLDDVQIYDEVLGPGAIRFLAENPGAFIPEPATLALLALGGLGLRLRKRSLPAVSSLTTASRSPSSTFSQPPKGSTVSGALPKGR
ncbi:MAG: LamG domain-containing protein [Planctomycetota bacterium]|nr:LamG domain-containing protein [Planctomycetota bacterium]